MGWYRSRDAHPLFAYGVDEFDAPGMQRDTSVAIRPPGPILQIAANGTSDLGELRSDLVVAPRLQIDL